MVCCMIIESKLDNRFWEAVMMANYIQNHLPWKSAKTTPYKGGLVENQIFIISGHLNQNVMCTSTQKNDGN